MKKQRPPAPAGAPVGPVSWPSEKELLILALLAGQGEMYGLQLVAASEGRLKRGTVYVTLNRMGEKGYVVSREEPRPEGVSGLPRPLYRATAAGLRILDAARALRPIPTVTAKGAV